MSHAVVFVLLLEMHHLSITTVNDLSVCCVHRTMKSHRAVVLLNLCVALIVANIVFVAGVDKTQPTV